MTHHRSRFLELFERYAPQIARLIQLRLQGGDPPESAVVFLSNAPECPRLDTAADVLLVIPRSVLQHGFPHDAFDRVLDSAWVRGPSYHNVCESVRAHLLDRFSPEALQPPPRGSIRVAIEAGSRRMTATMKYEDLIQYLDGKKPRRLHRLLN